MTYLDSVRVPKTGVGQFVVPYALMARTVRFARP